MPRCPISACASPRSSSCWPAPGCAARRTQQMAALSASCCWSVCFFRPLEKIAAVMEVYPHGHCRAALLSRLPRHPPGCRDKPGAVALTEVKGPSAMRACASPMARPAGAVNGIDLDIRAGESVAFVGRRARARPRCARCCRASTMSRGGSITIDGHDIRDVQLASLRRNIGIVQQDVFLFGGTIRENIAYGRLDAPARRRSARRRAGRSSTISSPACRSGSTR